MGQKQKIVGQQLESFIKDYESGTLLKELEIKYDIVTSALWALVKRHNLQPRGLGFGRRKKFSDELKENLMNRFKETRQVNLVGKEFGFSERVCQKYLREWFGDEEYEKILSQGRVNIAGKYTDCKGYVRILLRTTDELFCMVDSGNYAKEHRYIMAKYLNRPLTNQEQVHHIDGNKENNDITNLQLRIGSHGNGSCYECSECGSRKLKPVEI